MSAIALYVCRFDPGLGQLFLYHPQLLGSIKVPLNTCYKCFHAHTKLLSMRKWVFEIMYQIWVKTAGASDILKI